MNRNSVNYLHGISFSQLASSKQKVLKDLGRAKSDVAISQSLSVRIQTYMRTFHPVIYTKHKSFVERLWCKKNPTIRLSH
jgi:hypothetical protein